MKLTPNFYRDRVCLNVLAGSKEPTPAPFTRRRKVMCWWACSPKITRTWRARLRTCANTRALIDNALSVGLGAGDPNQSAMVSEISRQVQPQHVNQVFTGVATSRALLGQNETVVNGLVSPTGTVGMVKISTGPLSSDSAGRHCAG